jgi:hypothetical protein
MAEEDFERLLANVRDFDWNPNKRDQVFRERHIAFEDAQIAFSGTCHGGPVGSEGRSQLHGVWTSG